MSSNDVRPGNIYENKWKIFVMGTSSINGMIQILLWENHHHIMHIFSEFMGTSSINMEVIFFVGNISAMMDFFSPRKGFDRRLFCGL